MVQNRHQWDRWGCFLLLYLSILGDNFDRQTGKSESTVNLELGTLSCSKGVRP